MNSTATAVRDPIFFRWHKRVDTYIEKFNNTLSTELAVDVPPVKITAGDVLLTRSSSPPANFDEYRESSWVYNDFTSEDVHTELGLAQFEGEFGKLSHKPCTYHIRVARSDPNDVSNPLYLTIRMFICPANASEDRRRWIEMDKFRFTIPPGSPSSVITRQDIHSSVIRRNPEHVLGDIDDSATVSGFCECGWPYSLLFPCGLANGEPYKICVFISDNSIDQQGIRTRCGSLSYCGAQGQKYPDQRQMGYPFATPITVNGQSVSVSQAATVLTNMAITEFNIINTDVRYGPPLHEETQQYDKVSWYAQDQLSTSRQSPYSESQWTGTFRVLINGSAIEASSDSIIVQFEGRGLGKGEYVIANANIRKREPSTLSTTGETYAISFEGSQGTRMVIPEEGAKSLPIKMPFEEDEDYFITFQVLQPSCFLRNPNSTGQTLYSESGGEDHAFLSNWSNAYDRALTNIYAVSKIFVPE